MKKLIAGTRIPLFFMLALSAVWNASARAQGSSASDSAAIASIAQLEMRFFAAWREAWRNALDKDAPKGEFRPGGRSQLAYQRLHIDNHCAVGTLRESLTSIRSAQRGAAACPVWAYGPTSAPSVVLIEDAVAAALESGLLQQRKAVVAALDSALHSFPASMWLLGQRVRFLLDADHADSALRILRNCGAGTWWCSALSGYALYKRGDLYGADTAFVRATSATIGPARCDWLGIGMVLGAWQGDFAVVGTKRLDMLPRAAYNDLPCEQREAIARTAFWLADPLWSDTVNQRRVEHFARRVSIALRGAIPFDETYNWAASYGGDALAEMVMRYGWPTQRGWGGKHNDEAVAEQILARGGRVLPGTPYLTYEYARVNQVSLIPGLPVLRDPWSASETDLEPFPIPGYPFLEEHLGVGAIARIDAGQTALFRRDSTALFAFATDLRSVDFRYFSRGTAQLQGRFDSTVTAALLRSTGPESVVRVGTRTVRGDSLLILREDIAPERAILSVEIPNDRGLVARKRTVASPPPPLTRMARGTIAISDPLLLRLPGPEVIPATPAVAFSQMAPTTTLAKGTKSLGVYWETYGLEPADSVQLAIRVQRHTRQGAVERAAIALNMRGDRNAPVSIAWSEPQAGRAIAVTAAAVPIVSRTISIDISRLPAGEYWLDIGVQRSGDSAPVVGRREFVIQ